MFCASCQLAVPAGALFCASCGASTAATSAPTPAYVTPAYVVPPHTPAPTIRNQTAEPSVADFAVIAATVVLSPVFVRVFNFVRFVIALIGVSFVLRAIVHFKHVRGTPDMNGAMVGVFASFFAAFIFFAIAGWLGVVPKMARRFNALR